MSLLFLNTHTVLKKFKLLLFEENVIAMAIVGWTFLTINHICLTSLTRAKPKEKMEFPA